MNKVKIGDSFGQWIVIKDAGYMNNSRKAWLCKCSCGEIKKVLQQSLITNDSTKCRKCSNREKAKNRFRDLSNQEFGKWEVTSEYHITKEHRTYWVCKCKCGKVKSVKADSLIDGSSTCCGDCNTYKDIHSRFWSHKKNSARRRNIAWEITQQEAWELFINQNKKCIFTGLDIYLGKNIKKITASLDRKDSTLGYTKENCQWTHKIVNIIKWSLSNDEFIYIANLISDNNISASILDIDQIALKLNNKKSRWEDV